MNVHFSKITDNWRTPLNDDPCPIDGSGGLKRGWGSRTFINPPYSQLKAWCKKAYEESLKGKLIAMLIPSRTDTIAWHEYVMKAKEIRFIKGRLKFGDSKNSAPFPSAVIIFNRKQHG